MKKTFLATLIFISILLIGIIIPKLLINPGDEKLNFCAKIEASILFDHPVQKLLTLKVATKISQNADNHHEAISYTFFGIPYKKFVFDCNGYAQAVNTQVKFAVIALNDKGKLGKQIGCDDSVVYLNKTARSDINDLNSAFKALFDFEQQSFSNSEYKDVELTNLIFNVQRVDNKKVLFFEKAILDGQNAKIYLTGSMGNIGGVCDEPRVIEQIYGTALQFPEVKTVEVYLNNQLFDLKTFYSAK
jgi:hypothetical protein